MYKFCKNNQTSFNDLDIAKYSCPVVNQSVNWFPLEHQKCRSSSFGQYLRGSQPLAWSAKGL